TDRGSEYKNVGIDELLSTYNIERSLSHKGNPYDNAVAEATFKLLKTELINGAQLLTLEQLSLELFDYVNWYNNIRLHSSLGYLSPSEFRKSALKKVVWFSVDIPEGKMEGKSLFLKIELKNGVTLEGSS
ncbi:IS3 family transposase, partial [Bacillus sp. JJ722]